MKVIRKIGIAMILIGIIIIVSSYAYRYYCKQKTEKLYAEMMNTIEENTSSPTNEKVQEEITGLGIIEIKSLNIKAPIAEGTTGDVLKYAIGHFKDTAMPGMKGNCCLAGHASNIYEANFVNLAKIEMGETIYIHTTKKSYKYKVTDMYVVEATQMEVLNQSSDKELTLITCTDNGQKRFIVKAKIK